MEPITMMLILGGLGAINGGLSFLGENNKRHKELDWQEGQAKEQYKLQQDYKDSMWSLQRGEALETLGIQKNRLAEAFGADVAGFNLGLEGQAMQAMQARAAMADESGIARAAQGASGTKGSGTLERRIGFQEGMFNQQLDLQDRANSLAMQGMARQYTNTFDDIGREVGSWGPGGWRSEAKGLEDAYGRGIYDLQMEGFGHVRQDLRDNFFTDLLFSTLGGAQSGAAFGAQVAYLQSMGGLGGGTASGGGSPSMPWGKWDWKPGLKGDYNGGGNLGLSPQFDLDGFGGGPFNPMGAFGDGAAANNSTYKSMGFFDTPQFWGFPNVPAANNLFKWSW